MGYESSDVVLRFEKSTTGRSSWPVLPEPVRRTANALGRLAPGLAARAAESLFLTTQRKPIPAREAVWLRGAERRSIRVDGRRLAVWSRGEGPTVLLVHGWSGRGSQLGAFVEPLVRRGFRVVGFDGPGHGDSQGRRSSVPELARAVEAVGRREGPLAGIVAHSLGAAATTLALHAGLPAERLVYLAPPCRLATFPERFCAMFGFSDEVARRMRRRIERRFDIDFDRIDGSRLARRFQAPPLLVIHDRRDRDVPLADGRRLADAWPGGRLLVTDGLGHRALLREPEIVRRAIDAIAVVPVQPGSRPARAAG